MFGILCDSSLTVVSYEWVQLRMSAASVDLRHICVSSMKGVWGLGSLHPGDEQEGALGTVGSSSPRGAPPHGSPPFREDVELLSERHFF